jgi:hypothetical protein
MAVADNDRNSKYALRLRCLACSDCNWFVEIWAETSIVYNKKESNGNDLPTIEDLLYTILKKKSFTTKDLSSDHKVWEVEKVVVEKKGDFTNYNRSALGKDSGSSPGECTYYPHRINSNFLWYDIDDPIVLLGNDDLGASKAEVDIHCVRFEAMTSYSTHFRSPSLPRSRTSTGDQLSQENRLYISWSIVDEYEYENKLVYLAFNMDTFDKGER